MKTMYHIHKGIHTITALLSAAVLLLLTTVIAACAEADFLDGSQQLPPTDGLAIMPSAWEMKVPTRLDDYSNYDWTNYDNTDEGNIADDDNLKEGDIGEKLDVFIAGVTTPAFWKEYHLTQGELFAGATAKVEDQQLDVLATGNWFDSEGIIAGQTYDVYVAVNTEATHPEGGVGSKTALMALTNTNTDVDKIYEAEPGLDNASDNRRMMMDGHTTWMPTTDLNQTISVQLKRAEAKVVVHVTFDPAFYLTRTRTDGYKIESPMWKYVNWDQKTRVFADAPPLTLDELDLKSNTGRAVPTVKDYESSYDYYYTENDGVMTYYSTIDVVEESGHFYYYQPGVNPADPPTRIEVQKATSDMAVDVPYIDIITYTYAFGWGNEPMKYAPYILVSYGYSKGENNTSYNYYRIPLVDESTTNALRRNHIYRSSAVIAGNGSASLEEYSNPVKLSYEVVDWTERDSQLSKVSGDRLYFFNLEPKAYNLYGGTTAAPTKTQVISYSAHSDAQVRIKDIKVYYYNNDGTASIQTVAGGDNTTYVQLSNSEKGYNYSISVDNEHQQITVTSDVLKNHAVKYIKFKAYTSDRDDWETQGFFANVTVKHFPIDNIQSISGKWSSRWTGNSNLTVSVQQKEYTYDLATAQSWGTYYPDEIEVSASDDFDRQETKNDGTPTDHDGGDDYRVNYTTGQNGSTVQNQYRNNVTQGDNRRSTNGETNAILGNDGYWYWANTQTNSNNNNWDWRTGFLIYTYYRWSNYYRSQYKKTHYYRTRYYREVTVQVPSAGDWTDYEKKTGGTYDGVNYAGDNGLNRNYGFRAKWFDETNSICRQLNANGSASNTSANVTTIDGKNNNHMYVIQITATSSEYVLGRPTIDGNYQSKDHVVSPAFMIASQLGAVSSAAFNASLAATHCGTYMEVGTDKTRYTHWRLPTAEEVKVIIKYQGDDFVKNDGIMSVVLGGANYYTLDGNSQPTGYIDPDDPNDNGTYVRCIRDLSAEEVKKLNEGNQ